MSGNARFNTAKDHSCDPPRGGRLYVWFRPVAAGIDARMLFTLMVVKDGTRGRAQTTGGEQG